MRDDGDWVDSTEGDLDPDLTEEAGYMGWEAPDRRWLWTAVQIAVIVGLISLVGGSLVVFLR